MNLFIFFLFCDWRVFKHTSRFILCADVPSFYPNTLSAHLCWQETWLGVWHLLPYMPASHLTAHNWLTDWLTPRSSVLLEKLVGLQLVKQVFLLHGNWEFIAVFTRAGHLPLPWATTIQSMYPTHILKTCFDITFPRTPGSSKWSLSVKCPHQSHICISPLHHMCHMTQLYHLSLIWSLE